MMTVNTIDKQAGPAARPRFTLCYTGPPVVVIGEVRAVRGSQHFRGHIVEAAFVVRRPEFQLTFYIASSEEVSP
jgi:hypothetical protein